MGKSILITMAAVAVIFTTGMGNVNAEMIVQDFEGIPDTYLYHGGNQNLGGYLPGLDFGPDVTILDKVRYGYNSGQYPPHSGDAVIWAGYSYDRIRVDFLDLPSTYVEAWFTCTDTVYMEAYDAFDNLVDSASGPPNYPGVNSLISVSASNIAYVIIHDSGNCLTVDDFAYSPIPEPATLSLLAVGAVALIRRRKK